jgi:hypothetical protein
MSKNNNSKHLSALQPSSLQVRCHGDLSVRQKNDQYMLTFRPRSRHLLVESLNVSSVSSKNTETLIKKMKTYDKFTAILSSEQGELKLLNVYNVQNVRKDGVSHLRMNASVGEFEPFGNFAQNALEDIKSQNNMSLSLVSAPTQLINGVIFNEKTRTLTFLLNKEDPTKLSFNIDNNNGGVMFYFYNNVTFTKIGGLWQVQMLNSPINFTISKNATIQVFTTITNKDGDLRKGNLIGKVTQIPVTIE